MVNSQLWDAAEAILEAGAGLRKQIANALAPKKKKRKKRFTVSWDSIRTYYTDESRQARISRIESETQMRLNADQRNRIHARCTKCLRKIRSKMHRCPMTADTRKRW